MQPENPTANGSNEQELTRKYVLMLADKLSNVSELEVSVCKNNEPTNNIVNYCNNVFKPHLAIDHHTNANAGVGTEVFCYMAGDSKEAMTLIYNKLSDITPWIDRGIKDGYAIGLFFIKDLFAPSGLIEIVAHDNPEYLQHFLNHMDLYVDAEYEAILEYFKIKPQANDFEKQWNELAINYKDLLNKYDNLLFKYSQLKDNIKDLIVKYGG
jgi:hypothetical protein